ncbi:MAG: hypothetical protein AAFN78_15895 [Pseudomonadota bacterium]
MARNFAHPVMVAALALAAFAASTSVSAEIHRSLQDTYIYEFLGNQGAGTGDSGGLLTWNHENIHGSQALIQIGSSWTEDPALDGEFVALLYLYQACAPGGFISACPGDPGAPSTTTDVVLQAVPWEEESFTLGWEEITQTGPSVTFTQTEALGWISVDVTSLVQAWLQGAPDYGLVLTQEAYPVIRDTNGFIPVSAFCDSESTSEACSGGGLAPYLEIIGTADTDSDGVADSNDNCTDVANPDQIDSNGDGYGNFCDADLNDDCGVNAGDLALLKQVFFTTDPDADFNSDGQVNFTDLGIMRDLFFAAPGPSGTTETCE